MLRSTAQLRMNCDAAAVLTTIPLVRPVMLLVTVSVAVSDWLPAVLSVAEKVCLPASLLVNLYLAGRTALALLLVNWTVPR